MTLVIPSLNVLVLSCLRNSRASFLHWSTISYGFWDADHYLLDVTLLHSTVYYLCRKLTQLKTGILQRVLRFSTIDILSCLMSNSSCSVSLLAVAVSWSFMVYDRVAFLNWLLSLYTQCFDTVCWTLSRSFSLWKPYLQQRCCFATQIG